jgi:hypothetical protein
LPYECRLPGLYVGQQLNIQNNFKWLSELQLMVEIVKKFTDLSMSASHASRET